jgi:hypothetical protein
VNDFTQEPALRLEVATGMGERALELAVKHVGRIQPEAVRAELTEPHPGSVEEVRSNIGMGCVELDEIEMVVPAFVTERVAAGLRLEKSRWNQSR